MPQKASHIERPPKPPPKEHHLTREQMDALVEAATMPDLRLFIVLAYATGARSAALLGLTWQRCDFAAGMIDLRDPTMTLPHKGRAIVPMSESVKDLLSEARDGALSEYVIEWGGERVASVKRGLAATAKRAGVDHVSPHMLRHTAAVHMAESGISMEEIAQYLGHDDVETTRRVYARFSPTYLRNAPAPSNFRPFRAPKVH
jgi:integrase